MDLIDLSPSIEKSCSKAAKSLPPSLLPSVEFEGRLSISGDPFEKVLSQASLNNDPFECMMKARSAPENTLATNMGDLETFVQNSPMYISSNCGNCAFLFCEISPILNSSSTEQVSLLNNAFLHTSSVPFAEHSLDKVGEKIVEDFRKSIGPDPVRTEVGESEEGNKSVLQNNEKDTVKVTEWHSIVAEVDEEISAETPPLLVTGAEEDSLDDFKIPALEHIVAETASSGLENISSSPEKPSVNESIVEFSEVIEDLRRRMKDVLNKRICPSDSNLDVTDKTPDAPGVHQETFNIEREPTRVLTEPDSEQKYTQEEMQKNEESAEETFIEKLRMMCEEHNVSVVQDASQAQENQSMIVVYVNDISKGETPPSTLKRRNSYSSEIPRAVMTPNASMIRKRRTVTTTAHPTVDLEPREWKCPVGRVLPSSQMKIHTEEIKPRATVSPMRAIRPQPKIQVNENTPPKRVATKRRSLVAMSTPKGDSRKLVACSTPFVMAGKFPKKGPKDFMAENNKIPGRKSTTSSK